MEEIENNFYRFGKIKKKNYELPGEIDWKKEKYKEDEDLSDTEHEFGFDNIKNPTPTTIPNYFPTE